MPKFKPVSIKDLLRVGEVDDDELAAVLGSIFPRGAQLSSNEVEYRNNADDWILSLRYRDGTLVDAVTGLAYSEETGQQIRQALVDSVDGTDLKVWRVPMFSMRRVEGWYRHGDDFLIRPAPAEAPRPDEEYAEHPWVLEFIFTDSPTFRVRTLRTQRRAHELALVLNLLLGGQIGAPSNRARKHWVLPSHAEFLAGAPPEWRQESYYIPGLEVFAESFTDVTEWTPLARDPTKDYYTRRGFSGQPLTVPATMSDLCAAFDSLGVLERSRFLRSCYWLRTADVVWTYSQSLHLVSFINAVECLAQSGEKRLATDASTKMFLDFMEAYAPGRPSRTRINKIYDARSLVTHGERLLGYDTPLSFGLHPTTTADRESGTETVLLARGAIINWLVRRAGISANLLDADPYPKRPPAKPGTKSSTQIVTPQQ
jgi:hypothetical protein